MCEYKETKNLLDKHGEFLICGQLTVESSNCQATDDFKGVFRQLRGDSVGIPPGTMKYGADDVYKEFMTFLSEFMSLERVHLIAELFFQLEIGEDNAFRSPAAGVRHFISFSIKDDCNNEIKSEKDISPLFKQYLKPLMRRIKELDKTKDDNKLKTSLERILSLIGIKKTSAEIEILYSYVQKSSEKSKSFLSKSNQKTKLFLQKVQKKIGVSFNQKPQFMSAEEAGRRFNFLMKVLAILEGISAHIGHALQDAKKKQGTAKKQGAKNNSETDKKIPLAGGVSFFPDVDLDDEELKNELERLHQELGKIKCFARKTVLKLNKGCGELLGLLDEIDPYLNAIVDKIRDEDSLKDAATASLSFLRLKRQEFSGNGIQPIQLKSTENSLAVSAPVVVTKQKGKSVIKICRKSLKAKINHVEKAVLNVDNSLDPLESSSNNNSLANYSVV